MLPIDEFQVTDNVCYDIMGHAYFIEDGVKKG